MHCCKKALLRKILFLLLLANCLLISCKKEGKPPLSFNKVLILGNSITIHPPLSSIGWAGNWGMAASIKEKDYSHILAVMLNAEVIPVNISEWEHTHATFELTKLDSYFRENPDLIIIRLGENVQQTADFKKSLSTLISYIQSKNASSKLLLTGRFWKHDLIDQLMAGVAMEKNIPFVSLSHLDTGENVSHIGARVYSQDGLSYEIKNKDIANHPGDLGMKRIAENIYSAIRSNFM